MTALPADSPEHREVIDLSWLAIGRLYDPSGESELAPLDDFGRQNLGARSIEFRSEGDWQAA